MKVSNTRNMLMRGLTLGVAALGFAGAAFAQEAGPSVEDAMAVSAYVDNTMLFLVTGLVVMFMAAGFCMLEAGLVRSKNAAMQSMKNIVLYAVAGIMFYLVGYNLLYPGEWTVALGSGGEDAPAYGIIGQFMPWSPGDTATVDGDYASSSDWYFQMVFVATAASVVSGTVAERVKLWPFLIFTAVLTAIIYPIQCSWVWGGGFLADLGFSDFAGSTLVHSCGGWAALAGAFIIGPRTGKYVDGKVNPMVASNIPLAALGTLILWFGWFGFNGGSQLAAGTVEDVNSVAKVFINTNMAAAAGTVFAVVTSALMFKGKIDPTLVFNGAIGGLVAITASPLNPSLLDSIGIGGVGGILAVVTVPLLDKLKIDDVVGAIPAHLVAGIWGTIAVSFNVALADAEGNPVVDADGAQVFGFTMDSLIAQLTGIAAIGVFVFIVSFIVWTILKFTLGVRVSEEEEMEGLDRAELGLEAYPEFSKM